MKSTTDYQRDFQYENGVLQFIAQPEGYIYKDSTGYRYVYQYKDHLGNNRLSFMRNAGTVAIVKETNYYPFGLTQKGYNNLTTSLGSAGAKKYQYNGKELQDDYGLDWSRLRRDGARFYDAGLGRFFTIDPLANKYAFQSPYVYGINNPIRFVDFMGMGPEDKGKEKKEIPPAFELSLKFTWKIWGVGADINVGPLKLNGEVSATKVDGEVKVKDGKLVEKGDAMVGNIEGEASINKVAKVEIEGNIYKETVKNESNGVTFKSETLHVRGEAANERTQVSYEFSGNFKDGFSHSQNNLPLGNDINSFNFGGKMNLGPLTIKANYNPI